MVLRRRRGARKHSAEPITELVAARGRAAGRSRALLTAAALVALAIGCSTTMPHPAAPTVTDGGGYPWHTSITATTFWVGEVLDPSSPDGSQRLSAYDTQWETHYGGCDGLQGYRSCQTEPRIAANDFFPSAMTPRQNPFYLDLPFDDLNNAAAHRQRSTVVPWARQSPPDSASLMKNRWVQLVEGDRTCYGQIEDAGPEQYDDAGYVFGSNDQRPANRKLRGAGLDVSPALNGCLGFSSLNGDRDRVNWRFVDAATVPPGPWTRLITTTPVTTQ